MRFFMINFCEKPFKMRVDKVKVDAMLVLLGLDQEFASAIESEEDLDLRVFIRVF